MRGNGEGHRDGGDNGGDVQRKASSRTLAHIEGMKHLGCDSSDGSSRHTEDARAGENGTGPGNKSDEHVDTGSGGHKRGPSRGEGGTRSSIRLADKLNEAKLGRGHWPRGADKKKEAGQTDEGGGGVTKTTVAKSNVQPHFGRSRSPRIGVVSESSGEEKADPAAVAGGGKILSRSHRRTAPKLPPDSSLPQFSSSSVRHRRETSADPSAQPGANVHANATAKRTRHGSRSRTSARTRAPAPLAESPLGDVRALACIGWFKLNSII